MRKIFIAALMSMIMLTACQPTPEDAIVKSKAGEALEEGIQKTTDESLVTGIPEEAMEQYGPTESYLENSAVNERGNISLNIDAAVYQPSVSNIPVATVELHRFTQNELDDAVTALAGEAKFLNANILTKGRLDELIIRIKQNQNDLNSDLAKSNDIKTITELHACAEKEIERLQLLYEDAADDESECLIDYIDATTDSAVLYVYNNDNNSTPVRISYHNTDSSVSLRYINFGDNNESRPFTDLAGRPHGELYNSEKQYDIGISYEEAKTAALNALSEMNVSNMIIGETYITYDPVYPFNRANMVPKYYVFCFHRIVNNVIIDNSYFSEGVKSDIDSDVQYSKPLGNEWLRMWVGSTGIVQFEWNNPLSVSEILNDSVELSLSMEAAISAMETQSFIQYADMYGNTADNVLININKITLSLGGIVYKGHPGQYIVVLVWDFYGDVIITSDDKFPARANLRKTGNDNEYTINNPFNSIMTINAIDGTIISREQGY